ncbi:MAG: discoidin domain-containing protein, partial [Gammaproteobacteria bacterium]|nr:discoidin domain-containing protein [Gammaproteobacteria bacterium]
IDPSWLALDLGAEFALTDVIIHWEAANAATYEIQGSTDNVNWINLSSQSGGTFGDRTDNISVAGTYRYVRMFGLSRTSVYGYSIYEMEVYGTAGADSDGDGVDDSIDQCPGTPAGSTVAANGCIDTDGDGVDDTIDQCPGTPAGAQVDSVGCELVIPVNEVSAYNNLLVGGSGSAQPGFTLYVFDNDLAAPGTSTCNGGCASTWPPLLVADGVASGATNLGTITRNDAATQATYNGRPLYFYAGDTAVGDTLGDGSGNVWHTVSYVQTVVPLFDNTTVLEPVLQEDTPTALITRLADRARDRHAREEQFQQYDHYLSFYWEHRTAEIEIVDTVGKGGNSITFNVITEWPVNPQEAELRFFHLSEAVYANNGIMTAVPELDVPGEDRRHYTRSVTLNSLNNQPLAVGDLMEFELSQFLTGTPNGRDNYYGTAILYVVGQGVEPWEGVGAAQNPSPMPAAGRLGGDTTLPYQYSDEPDHHFQQMSTNLSNINGQTFVLGRRVHHTDFGDGSHDEAAENADFTELANTLGTNYVNRSCIACHTRNGRAVPPAVGQELTQYVVKVGDANGFPDPNLGAVLQPQVTSGTAEGSVNIASWTENNGLRTPNFSFTGANTPTNYSARIAPQLVGMGLLEAIDEADIQLLADENDSNSDGISGRVHLVTDAVTSETRIGRFGWKASQPSLKQQVASALNTDVGVMTSILPNPDCGAQQSDCGSAGSEIADEHLDNLTAYIALLGLSARRDLSDATALQGEALFDTAGCNACHVDTFQTSQYHPHAELRDQTIHPYTDLLLHDMGPGLASNLPEGDAAGAEWRTAPLWNIGLTSGVSGGEGYLHDGRARTLHEAIMWHGGEADASRLNYEALSQTDKDALIAFLESL